MKLSLTMLLIAFVGINAWCSYDQGLGIQKNLGQVSGEDANDVKYYLTKGDICFFFLSSGIAYQFNKTKSLNPESKNSNDSFDLDNSGFSNESYRVDMFLSGASKNPTILAENESKDVINYYTRNVLGVHHYGKITYQNIYPNIDWVIYINGDELKYDFIVHPGGDPSDIIFKFKWAVGVALNNDGGYSLETPLGIIKEQNPVSFQKNSRIKTSFVKNNLNELRFNIEEYNPDEVLVIDPAIQWSTFYGGDSDEYGGSTDVDQNGNVFLAGWTFSSINIANGGYQMTYGGGNSDGVLIKFSPSGQRLWSTYYGGDQLDKCYSVALDAQGNSYLSGWTSSTINISYNGFQNTSNGGSEAFLVKFDSDGNRIWASYFGGELNENVGNCSTDGDGNIYLCGNTGSLTGISYNGYQSLNGGGNDAFLVKFNANGMLLWSTYYGGEGFESGYCESDQNNNVYISGRTNSSQNISFNGFQNSISSMNDAYLVKFNAQGIRQWATYYGGEMDENSWSCATDLSGNVYLSGWTASQTGIAYLGYQETLLGIEDAFLVSFDGQGNRNWATYFGGEMNENALFCRTDLAGNIYLTGSTYSQGGISMNGFQTALSGNSDAYLAKFTPQGTVEWSSYYGGSSDEFGFGIQLDLNGSIYLGGCTYSIDTIGVGGFQNSLGGSRDFFLAKFSSGGINEISENYSSQISCYPNPAESTLFVELAIPSQLNVYSVTGNLIMTSPANTQHNLDINEIPSGVYILLSDVGAIKFIIR